MEEAAAGFRAAAAGACGPPELQNGASRRLAAAISGTGSGMSSKADRMSSGTGDMSSGTGGMSSKADRMSLSSKTDGLRLWAQIDLAVDAFPNPNKQTRLTARPVKREACSVGRWQKRIHWSVASRA